MLAFKDVSCIEAEMEDIYRVYRSDAPVRLGPSKLPCSGFTFVVKRKTGMETYLAFYAREIKRSLIYQVDPEARGIGDPSSQIKKALDLLKGIGFKLDPVNLKFGAAMLEVVLQDVPPLMSPSKAQKTNRERDVNLAAWENHAAYLRDNNLLDADEKTLSEMAREDRNRYNTAVSAYQKLEIEDYNDEQREFLFEYIDAVLHGRTPPKPGSFIQGTAVKPPTVTQSEQKAPPPKTVQQEAATVPPKAAEKQPDQKVAADEKPKGVAPEKQPSKERAPTVIRDPKDKQRIEELELTLGELKDKLRDMEGLVEELRDEKSELSSSLKKTQAKLKEADGREEHIKELEVELETAQHDADEAQKEIRRLKSDNAKYRRKIEDLEDQKASVRHVEDEPARPASRLNTGRLLSASTSSSSSSSDSATAPHVLRKPPPAGATFGVDWDLEFMPCTSLDQVVELHQSICNAQLTLEGYTTQYCSAFIFVISENGGRQLYMVFNLTQEGRFLIYKPIKRPASSSDISRLVKEAQRFLQVCGIETEKLSLKQGDELPSGELKNLFANI